MWTPEIGSKCQRFDISSAWNRKQAKVAVFADGTDAAAATKAGADVVGFEDLIEKIKKEKNIDADVIIATPDCMKSLGQLGRILGPKNLMPNPKEGTVTKNVADAVSTAKKGQIRYKSDKGGIIHATIGKRTLNLKTRRKCNCAY